MRVCPALLVRFLLNRSSFSSVLWYIPNGWPRHGQHSHFETFRPLRSHPRNCHLHHLPKSFTGNGSLLASCPGSSWYTTSAQRQCHTFETSYGNMTREFIRGTHTLRHLAKGYSSLSHSMMSPLMISFHRSTHPLSPMFKYLYAYLLFLMSKLLEFRMDGNSSRLYLSFSDVPLSDEEEDPPIF